MEGTRRGDIIDCSRSPIGHDIYGHGDADAIYGSDQADFIAGGDRNDTIFGGGGNDTIDGGWHTDECVGGDALSGNDTFISGELGDDT
ncbi:MAG: hypothetical protein VCC99_01555 [Alphaproteobacteria bacterium]